MATSSSAAIPTADFGSRFSAFVIDAGILFGGQWIAIIVLSRQLQAVGLTESAPCEADAARMCEGPSSVLWFLLLLFLLVTTIGYHAFFEGRFGATPGKKWMGLRVSPVQGAGPLSATSAMLRSVIRQGFWLSLFFVFDASPLGLSLPPALFIIVPFAALGLVAYGAVAADGRGVHDHVAGTQVVRADHDRRAVKSASVPMVDLGGEEELTLDDSSEESEESEESV